MAKATGIYGNFNGKIGNTVGFKIAQSRNRQNQGVRIYQPSVGNPKTAAQAEQRARVAAVQGTYTMLRNIIDRGNERQPYGYASRVAWLRQAYRSEIFPWYPKGARITAPVGCQLTKGSLNSLNVEFVDEDLRLTVNGITSDTNITTVGKLTTALITSSNNYKVNDQLTFVLIAQNNGSFVTELHSIILDTQSTDAVTFLSPEDNRIVFINQIGAMAGTVILSRKGAYGKHLRSTQSLIIDMTKIDDPPYDAASKAAAIASYQSAGADNSDWAEEATI